VNAAGDVMTGYVRRLSETQLQVRYALWRSKAESPNPSLAIDVDAATFGTAGGKVDYAWAVVDPADDLTFWLAHDYRWSAAGNNTVLVRIPGK
jgi:hypothetical protein